MSRFEPASTSKHADIRGSWYVVASIGAQLNLPPQEALV